jgi:hypothetical protein
MTKRGHCDSCKHICDYIKYYDNRLSNKVNFVYYRGNFRTILDQSFRQLFAVVFKIPRSRKQGWACDATPEIEFLSTFKVVI